MGCAGQSGSREAGAQHARVQRMSEFAANLLWVFERLSVFLDGATIFWGPGNTVRGSFAHHCGDGWDLQLIRSQTSPDFSKDCLGKIICVPGAPRGTGGLPGALRIPRRCTVCSLRQKTRVKDAFSAPRNAGSVSIFPWRDSRGGGEPQCRLYVLTQNGTMCLQRRAKPAPAGPGPPQGDAAPRTLPKQEPPQRPSPGLCALSLGKQLIQLQPPKFRLLPVRTEPPAAQRPSFLSKCEGTATQRMSQPESAPFSSQLRSIQARQAAPVGSPTANQYLPAPCRLVLAQGLHGPCKQGSLCETRPRICPLSLLAMHVA